MTSGRKILVAVAAVAVTPVIALLAWVWAVFYAGALYSGDGEYRHPGTDGAAFQVEFPRVDLRSQNRQTFQFKRLGPAISWVVRFRVDELSPAKHFPDALVRLRLTNERNEEVFNELLDFAKQSVNGRLIERDGVLREIPIGGGSVRIELVGRGPDGGWGTHFDPRWFGRYKLEVTVIRSSSADTFPVRLVMEAYMGWP